MTSSQATTVNRRRTPAETELTRIKAVELRQQGMLYRDISRELKVAKSVLVRWLSKVPASNTASAKYKELKERCRSDYRAGKRFREIQREHGVTDGTLTLWIRDLSEKRKADPSYVFTSAPIDATQRRNNGKRMTDEQVIQLRREVKREKTLNSRKWVRQFGVSASAITLAARGVQYTHLNHIETPATIEDTKYKPRFTRTQLELRKTSFTDLIVLVEQNASRWTFQSMAEWMRKTTGGGYESSHIRMLLAKRAPHLLDVVRDAPVGKVSERKIIRRRMIKRLCCVCENSFDTTDPDAELCDDKACHAIIEAAGED